MSSFVKLHSGAEMPKIGLGTWTQARGGAQDPKPIIDAVTAGVEAGYRHIDTAWAYQNEKDIGTALKDLFSRGVVKREDLFITTKLFAFFHDPKKVETAAKMSLAALGLDYVDMYLIHFPIEIVHPDGVPMSENKYLKGEKPDLGNTPHTETWKAMESLVEKGMAKHIGLCNFNSKQIQRIVDIAKVPVANVQVECNAYFPQEELQAFCAERGIAFTGYSPIGSPGSAALFARYGVKDHPKLMEDPVVLALANKYNKSPAQILIRYLFDRNIIAIPKSTNVERIKANIDIMDIALSAEDIKSLTALKKGRIMGHAFDWGIGHPDYPYDEPF